MSSRVGASTCNCATSTNHGDYVKCVKGVANDRASQNPPLLPKNCKGQVVKCAAKSVCGKGGFVTCCITKPSGTKCKTKKDAMHCTDKEGIVGHCASCCDACPAPGTPGCQSPKQAQHTYRFYYLKRLFAPEPIPEVYASDRYPFNPATVKVFTPPCPYAYPAELAAWYDQR